MDLRELVSGKTYALYDPEFIRALRALPWSDWLGEARTFACRQEYLDFFPRWIAGSRLNSIRGLERFTERHLINGTTQTFDEAYFKYAGRRLRIFRGEYAYHTRICKDFGYLDDEPLAERDYVIVSAPFCSTGDVHPDFYAMLERAAARAVPVLVDCAYFGTCLDFSLDVNSPAIESVSFSLTKGLGLGDIRSGIRFSDLRDQNPVCQQNQYDHSVLAAAKIGLYMMKRFGPDHIPERFRQAQLEVCAELGVAATKCMHLALGGPEWDHLKVNGKYNRLGIREAVKAVQSRRRAPA